MVLSEGATSKLSAPSSLLLVWIQIASASYLFFYSVKTLHHIYRNVKIFLNYFSAKKICFVCSDRKLDLNCLNQQKQSRTKRLSKNYYKKEFYSSQLESWYYLGKTIKMWMLSTIFTKPHSKTFLQASTLNKTMDCFEACSTC